MNNYGTDADKLKRAFDDTIQKDYNLLDDRSMKLLVSQCADNTSINMGRYNGV